MTYRIEKSTSRSKCSKCKRSLAGHPRFGTVSASDDKLVSGRCIKCVSAKQIENAEAYTTVEKIPGLLDFKADERKDIIAALSETKNKAAAAKAA